MNIVKCTAATVMALAASGTAFAEGSSGSQDRNRSSSQQSSPQQGQSKSPNAPVVLIVPLMTATDEAMARGCWARLYDTTNFSGNMLTLSGTVEIPTMESGRIAGFEWDRNFDSVIIGPKATLMVWQGDNYSDYSTTFRSNQRVQDLDTRMGFFEDIKSLKLSCTDMGGNTGSTGSGTGGSGQR